MSENPDMDRRLRLAREVFSPSSDHRERVRAGLVARARGPGSATLATPATSATPAIQGPSSTLSNVGSGAGPALTAGARAAGLAKAMLLVGAGFALGYGFAEARGTERPAPPVTPVASASPFTTGEGPTSAGSASTTLLPEGAPTPRDAQTASPIPRSDVSADSLATRASRRIEDSNRRAASKPRPAHEALAERSTSRDAFADEVALLQRADRAIRSGNAGLARSFIAELEARFPQTALRQERAAILVLAACALGEPDARDEASAFSTSHPSSVYVDRISALCQLDASHAKRALTEDGSARHGH